MMKKYWQAVLACAFVGGTIIPANAQPVAQRPAISVGDAWEFKNLTTPGDKAGAWSRLVVEIAPNDVLKVRQQDGKIFDYDGAMNFMPEGRADYARVLVKYPLRVGDEWGVARKFPNPNVSETGNAKVITLETITVPAGTFQCYRIEAASSLVNKTYSENRTRGNAGTAQT